MHIHEYLCRVGKQMTECGLPEFSERETLDSWLKERRPLFWRSLGIDRYLADERDGPPPVEVTASVEREEYRLDTLCFESLPGLYVTGNLYLPRGVEQPVPGVIYVCGHSQTQKVNYQDHPRHFAQLGFAALILDTIEFGEVRGVHHGMYRYGYFNWMSRGYTPAAVEVWNAIRGLDLLAGLDEVDASRVGITGTSGGGAISWWTAAADERFAALAPSCGTGTTASHLREMTVDGHCDCMFPSNPYGWSLLETRALVAPRPLLIVSPSRDGLFSIEAIREVHERLKGFYAHLGLEEKIDLYEFRAPHSYSTGSRKAVFRWFVRHLQGRGPDAEVGDCDDQREDEGVLSVYKGHLPPNDESTTVRDWFIPGPQPLEIDSIADLKEKRCALVEDLRRESFATFPENPSSLEPQIEQRSLYRGGSWGQKFSYQSETAWRLWGELRGEGESDEPVPAVVGPRSPGDRLGNGFFSLTSGGSREWVRCRLDVRGTGRTAWGEELNWHLRRAGGLTGRTITSMHVWDLLRGLEAVRSWPGIDEHRITLAGEGEMAVVCLFAALLDGGIEHLILSDPPATLDAGGSADGTGPFLEIYNALRHTDLPQVAGMLWPTKIIFTGLRPAAYRWTERLYRKLGEPGGIWRVKDLREMRFLFAGSGEAQG